MKKTLTMLVAVTAVAALGLTACKDQYQKAGDATKCAATNPKGTWSKVAGATTETCNKPAAAAAGTTDTCPANKTKQTCPAATCTWADAVAPATVGTCTKKAT